MIGIAIATPLAVLGARYYMRPVAKTLLAVGDGIASLTDRDFSVSISAADQPELAALVEGYNRLGSVLRDERQSLYQRELLLDTVIQATPLSMVLTNANGRVVYSNVAARQTFLGGRKLEGLAFAELLAASPEPLRQAVATEADTLFTIEGDDESEIYHLSQRGFLLNSQLHRLYLLKQMTRELARQEVETWKKVIRVIAHELNNSLAPISSLAHSGRLTVERPDAVAARAHLPHDRGSRETSALVHRRLRAVRETAAAAARADRLARVPALAAGNHAVQARERSRRRGPACSIRRRSSR